MTDRIVAPLSDEERTVFIAVVRSFLTAGKNGGRVEYRHRGRNFRGVDCIGVPIYAMGVIGRDIRDLRVYSPAPDGHTLRDALIAHLGQPIAPEDMQPGDIALMRWHQLNGLDLFNHVGVVTPYPIAGHLALLHSYAPNQQVTEHIIGEPWDRRIVEGFRP